MSKDNDYTQSGLDRRDERATKGPDDELSPGKLPAKKKDTKKWCKGKVGREHTLVCHKYNEVKARNGRASHNSATNTWRVLSCSVCGRELAMYYGGKAKDKPEWVDK